MSRLFVLTFRGTERFREDTHGHDPHESPWVMTTPAHRARRALGRRWSSSTSRGSTTTHSPASSRRPSATWRPAATPILIAQYGLALVDVAAAVIGLLAAFSIWRDISESSRYESPFLEHVWHWDDFYDATIGRPLTDAAQFSDDVIEPKVIDGAVTGLAVSVRRSGEGLRKVQSGFVRHYALATVLGVAVIIVFLVARVG